MFFYIKKCVAEKDTKNLDLSFIPPMLRRKLGGIDKLAIWGINSCIDEKTDEIVYSSQYGEFERLLSLIEQYKSENEVSPTAFSASVHNYPLGLFSILNKKTIPYNALSACENSLSMGLLAALTSECENVLYCCCDVINETKCVCLNISKTPSENSKKIFLEKNNENKVDDFDEFIAFLKGEKNKIAFSNYILEAIKND